MFVPANEADRMRALRELELLDTPPNEGFDRITRMACQIFGVGVSAISLTDNTRQWFKSKVGCGNELPRGEAPCAVVTLTSDIVVIEDLASDVRFADGQLRQNGLRFYAGAPLITREGYTVGAMCVLGETPRQATKAELAALSDLASMVMAQIELQQSDGRIHPATGLRNRHGFVEDYIAMTSTQILEDRTALFIDLAGPIALMEYSRVLGPSYLDELLQAAVTSIKLLQREDEPLYQVGLAQLVSISREQNANLLRKQVTENVSIIRADLLALGIVGGVDTTVGMVPFRIGAITAPELLRAGLSAAQEARDNDTVIAIHSKSADAAHARRFNLVGALRKALQAKDELALVFQPRINFRTGECNGVEALLRWNHPELGAIAPSEFIPLAEVTDLSRPLTEWVLQAAVTQAAEWQVSGLDIRISVNVAATNLAEIDFAKRLGKMLAKYGLRRDAIEIEFTETALISNQRRVLNNLSDIRKLGVVCAIDDFGTGYSSLSYLQKIPAEVIKIDQSFIRELLPDTPGASLVSSMITMIQQLGFTVVAEGVETQIAYDLLSAFGCDEAQGYLISRPLTAGAFISWLADRTSAQAVA